MRNIILAKFAQNLLLGKKLIETGNQRLFEATTDPYWGASATITSKSNQEDKWKGANRYGILLMEHREELRRTLSIEHMKKSPAGGKSPKPSNNKYAVTTVSMATSTTSSAIPGPIVSTPQQ